MTTTPVDNDTIELLRAWRTGDSAAKTALFDALYRQLHGIARMRMARERGSTLAPTALVHEVFLRLDANTVQAEDRSAFLRLAATVMRRILVDHARRRRTHERSLAAASPRQEPAAAAHHAYILRVDDALTRLGECDVDLLRVVELRFLIGMSVEECATTLGTSTATVKRDWRTARAFLQREIEKDDRI